MQGNASTPAHTTVGLPFTAVDGDFATAANRLTANGNPATRSASSRAICVGVIVAISTNQSINLHAIIYFKPDQPPTIAGDVSGATAARKAAKPRLMASV